MPKSTCHYDVKIYFISKHFQDVALTAAHCCDGVPVTQMTIDAGGIDRITLDGMQVCSHDIIACTSTINFL